MSRDEIMALLSAHLSPDELEQATQRGRALDLEAAVARALEEG